MSVVDLPTASGARLRRAVRVVLLDPDDRVLLARYAGRRGPTWIFVGGGVDAGETDEQAARREVLEETGCGEFELGPELAQLRSLGPAWDGGLLDSRHRIFLGRCARFDPHPAALTPEEQAMDVVVRWWTADEMAASAERFEPDVPDLVAGLLTDGVPAEPHQREIVW